MAESLAQALRQKILAQIDRCAELAYGAGHHFAQHGKHAPSSLMAKADADAKLARLIEEYAAAGKEPGKCGSECDHICQQPDGFGSCGKTSDGVKGTP